MNKNLSKAVKVLKAGGIVIFPTDTAFGVGCRIDDEKAINRLFKIRKRASDKAVPVLVSSKKMAKEYLAPFSSDVDELTQKYWPGALTLVLACNEAKVPSLVRGGGRTIGVRIPGNRSARDLIRKVGVPILGSSANFSGEKTPYKYSDLDPELAEQVDFVLSGRCSMKKASTVLDVTSKPWKVLREGAVDIQLK